MDSKGKPVETKKSDVGGMGQSDTTTNTGITLSAIVSNLVSILNGISLLVKKLTTPDDVLVNYPQAVVTIATPTRPDSPDIIANSTVVPPITGYDRIAIYYDRHRMANSIWVTNDGGDTLYVISSHNGINWCGESEIFPGESREFTAVYELRVRSPRACTMYRVTQYKPEPILSANLCAFTAQVINAPMAGALLPSITVPLGMTLVVRANVLNNGQVFLANSIANATNGAIPGNRNTLNAGDVVRLSITNANLVAVAGSAANQNVDILVEQRT
ncbi:MAG: hypothetical protein PHZ02_01595 [Desulfocapsaceae bacterium]|nr:hypothetical protein [Desulfocapsaceae bacterium]